MKFYCEECGTYLEIDPADDQFCYYCGSTRIKKADFLKNEFSSEISKTVCNKEELPQAAGEPAKKHTSPTEICLFEKNLIPFMEQIIVPTYVSFDELKKKIFEQATAMNIKETILFGTGTVLTDAIFNRKSIDCLAFQNYDYLHDYYGYCITRLTTGCTTIFSIYNYGKSKQMSKETYLNNTRAFTGNGTRSAVAGAFRGGAVGAGFAVGGMIGGAIGGSARLIRKGIVSMTMDKIALEEEKSWYIMMNTLFQQVFFGE